MNKDIINSTLPLLIVVILFVVIGNFGIGRINLLRQEISQARNDQATLTQKVETLKTITTVAETGSQAATAALPGANSSIAVLSQLKTYSLKNGVFISNLKSGDEIQDTNGLSRVDMSFDVTGLKAGIIAFLQDLQGAAPVVLVNSVKLTESAVETRGTVSLRSYWASFPTKLPAVTDQVLGLTNDEQATLVKVNALSQPQFVKLPPSVGGRLNPFAP